MTNEGEVPKTIFKVSETIDFSRIRICFLLEKPHLLNNNQLSEYVRIPQEQIAIWNKEGKYELVRGEKMLREAIEENWELLEAGKEVTVAFPLRKLGTPKITASDSKYEPTLAHNVKSLKASKFKLPTSKSESIIVDCNCRGFQSLTDSLKNLRNKAISLREKVVNQSGK